MGRSGSGLDLSHIFERGALLFLFLSFPLLLRSRILSPLSPLGQAEEPK